MRTDKQFLTLRHTQRSRTTNIFNFKHLIDRFCVARSDISCRTYCGILIYAILNIFSSHTEPPYGAYANIAYFSSWIKKKIESGSRRNPQNISPVRHGRHFRFVRISHNRAVCDSSVTIPRERLSLKSAKTAAHETVQLKLRRRSWNRTLSQEMLCAKSARTVPNEKVCHTCTNGSVVVHRKQNSSVKNVGRRYGAGRYTRNFSDDPAIAQKDYVQIC